MTRVNPTRPLRMGFHFQDLWALHLCAEFLLHPDKYRWIRFESIPEEFSGGRFTLDDVWLCDFQGQYHLYQVKHRDSPQNRPWSWSELLHRKKGKRGRVSDSLIQTWYNSTVDSELAPRIAYAGFVTNGFPDEQIQACMSGESISFRKLNELHPEIWSEFVSQLGSEQAVQSFFERFCFQFLQKEACEFEAEICERFLKDLGVTVHGLNSAYRRIQEECRRGRTRQVSFREIRDWCEFDDPRPLNQDFVVPEDFELFDASAHSSLLTELQTSKGGIRIVVGKPGVGKSTYVSKLYSELCDKGIPCFRHHYFLSTVDPSGSVRLDTERVVEALKAQLKDHPESLGKLANINSASVKLREFLTTFAEHCANRETAFVLIIDGLDHVQRSSDGKQLSELLSQILFPQPGFWILLAMQESAREHLPGIASEQCPREDWLEIVGLSEESHSRIVARNSVGLHLPTEPSLLEALCHELYKLTEGNPLHLRYTLRELRNQLEGNQATSWECRSLVPYGGDISAYYSSLWNKLAPDAQTLLLAVVILDECLEESQLFEFIGSFSLRPADVSTSYRAAKHLLARRQARAVVYHSSFQIFVTAQDEYDEQRSAIQRRAKEWLEHSSHEVLTWYLLPRLAYDLGEPDLVMKLDREWLVQAICQGRDSDQVLTLLRIGQYAAFEREDFGGAFTSGRLSEYYENALQFCDEQAKRIWIEVLWAGRINLRRLDLSQLQSEQIHEVVRYAEKDGTLTLVLEHALAVLEDRHTDLRFREKDGFGFADMPEIPCAFLALLARDRTHSIQRIVSYIGQYRETGWSSDLIESYSRALLEAGQTSVLIRLLRCDLSRSELRSVMKACVSEKADVATKGLTEAIASKRIEELPNLAILFLCLANRVPEQLPALPDYESFPTSVSEFDRKKRDEHSQSFYEGFLLGVLYTLADRTAEVQEWIQRAERRWTLDIMSQLFRAAMLAGDCVKHGKSTPIGKLLRIVGQVSPLEWRRDRNLHNLQLGLSATLTDALRVVLFLDSSCHQESRWNHADIERAIPAAYLGRDSIVRLLADQQTPILTDQSFSALMRDEQRPSVETFGGFPARADWYIDLARLARVHGREEEHSHLTYRASQNLVAYGYHKDMYLDEVLRAIRTAHEAGSPKAEGWLAAITPMVDSVTEFTDGDETNQFPITLASVLATVAPNLLRRYYVDCARREQLFLAERIFPELLTGQELSSKEGIAFAATAIDESGLTTLRSLSSATRGADEAVHRIEGYFGNIQFEPEYSSDPIPKSEEELRNVTAVTPHELPDYYSGLKSWDSTPFLAEWVAYWKLKPGETEATYDALKSLLGKNRLGSTHAHILDHLWSVAIEIDPEAAFGYACQAQGEHGGWAPYWYDHEPVEKRWEFVRSKFPERYLEFFKRSTAASGLGQRNITNTYVPLVRGVEYFGVFGRLDIIEDVVDSSVSFALSLLADLQLAPVPWLESDEVDTLDILLGRLFWPSPLVRERAACEVATLLRDSGEQQRVYQRLISLLEKQKLESLVAILLLPLLKSAEEPDAVRALDLSLLAQALPVTSIVTDELIRELQRRTGLNLASPVRHGEYWTSPSGFNPTEFFEIHVSSFLAPLYRHNLEKSQRSSVSAAISDWSYTSLKLLEALGLDEEVGEIHRFYGSKHDGSKPGLSGVLSEVYRSAYLRVVRVLWQRRHISREEFLRYSLISLPVDLSYWKVPPSRRPDWWPMLSVVGAADTRTDELVRLSLREPLEQAISTPQGTVLGLDGLLPQQRPWSPKRQGARITVLGFAYHTVGPQIPAARAVYEELTNIGFFAPILETENPLGALDALGFVIWKNRTRTRCDDLVLYPLVARVRSNAMGVWQWFRDYGLLVAHPNLAESMTLTAETDGWKYVKEGQTCGTTFDWIEGLTEAAGVHFDCPHGACLVMREDVIDERLASDGLRLAHVVRIAYPLTGARYEDLDPYEEYRFLNLSPIII